ncbi:hypothetical protein [Gulosibacter faecalis]|uniref:hypothetical protein n=1 Tax=Gulosibacter faecalis TaxID=272240 RepID=UPI0003655F7B|nr:hypothetical protein [Gulosibacter faecalis]
MAHRILLTRRDLDGHGAYFHHARATGGGDLFRIHRGTYLEIDAEVAESITPVERFAARAIAIGNRNVGVISGTAAAVLWHLPLETRRLTDAVTVTRASSGRATTGVEFRRAELADHEVVEIAGVRVTSIARTLRDLTIGLPVEEAYAAMNAALRYGHDVSPMRYYKGQAAKRMKWLLDNAHGRSDSVGESLLDYRLLVAGIEPPLRQPSVFDEDGTFVGRPDLLWSAGAIHEFDGTGKWLRNDGSAAKSRIRRAQRRGADLEALGWLVTSSQWTDVAGKSDVVTRIQQSLDQAAKLPQPRGSVHLLPLPPMELPDWGELFEVPSRFHYANNAVEHPDSEGTGDHAA